MRPSACWVAASNSSRVGGVFAFAYPIAATMAAVAGLGFPVRGPSSLVLA
ncbi:MAG: hypothetical protein JWO51_3810, partial [Rhodospirillales bacterium]|nr:hypothetical protein [Rhodospirillales bacterium]